MNSNSFKYETLPKKDIEKLKKISNLCRGDILKMTTVAGSGHPGGSMSSIDILSTIYKYANINSNNPCMKDRDRVIISNGHISPAVYSILGRNGFFDIDDAIAYFRKAGSPFEGHVDKRVPGVEMNTGNLGQGFSAAVGVALANKLNQYDSHTFVVMGDGEQQKGQIVESRRIARKYNLSNLSVIIDFNQLQISGSIHDIMMQELKDEYEATGWEVIDIDGHDFNAIYRALRYSVHTAVKPVAIIARTSMGKGVSFMQNDEKWHGQALSEDKLDEALDELGINNNFEKYRKKRKKEKNIKFKKCKPIKIPEIDIDGKIVYNEKDKLGNRTAFGKTLLNIAEKNKGKIAVFDCDLSGSVRTKEFANKYEDYFFQLGIQEHSAASISGGLSLNGFLTFWADFGVFAVDEVFNQLRLNEINKTNLKVIATHLGLNVGEDGKTHQSINYLGLFRSFFDFKVIIPADPNQTDKVIRHISNKYGNYFVGMGRAKSPIISKDDGEIFFDRSYDFEYGKYDVLREGDDATVFTYGPLIAYALEAHKKLLKDDINLRVVNVASPLEIDEKVVEESIKTGVFITYEDHNVYNGFGTILSDYLMNKKYNNIDLVKMGINEYGKSGHYEQLYKIAGLGTDNLVEMVKKNIK
ncbi:MAG: transketolase [Candidatus Mcinerneyibacterium aminivorans]|uniref:Transketolase n=1 Tax=Candidatus Mcinerneyibacterium aminivorans TaxID=2703815 RepID=A0A5D0MJA5_9BACT|nr:MAG: transketolase [Candidatus Mcinerneyibacterium aminivorans]